MCVLADLRALEYLIGRADDTAGRLVPAAVHRLAEAEDDSARSHVETLRAYVEADLNAKAAVGRLGIHTDTIHYRLGRSRERTGCDLRSLDDVVDIMVALQLSSGYPASAAGQLTRRRTPGAG